MRKKRKYKTGKYTSLKSGKVYEYRSGWEQKYMVWLDKNLDIIEWSYEEIIIQYISNLKTRRIRKYIPDFSITWKNGKKELIEIKPQNKVNQITNQKKFRFATNWCTTNDHEFVILTEHELKGLGVM